MTCSQLDDKLVAGSIGPGSLDPAELGHIVECDDCRGVWLSAALIRDTTGAQPERREDCQHTDTLHTLFEGVSGTGSDTILEHVADCGVCYRETLLLARDLDGLENASPAAVPPELEQRAVELPAAEIERLEPTGLRRSTGGRWVAALAVAAGIAFIAWGLVLLRSEQGMGGLPRTGTVLRGADSTAPVPLAPRGEASVSGLSFSWKAPQAGETGDLSPGRYRLVVLDLETGATVFEQVTDATIFTPTPEQVAKLTPGTRYHWIVEPIAGGAGAPSEAVAFRLGE